MYYIMYTVHACYFVHALLQLWMELFKFKCQNDIIHDGFLCIMQELCEERMKRVSLLFYVPVILGDLCM